MARHLILHTRTLGLGRVHAQAPDHTAARNETKPASVTPNMSLSGFMGAFAFLGLGKCDVVEFSKW